MLTIITMLGHGLDNFQRQLAELRSHVDRWVVVKTPTVTLDNRSVESYDEDLPDHWDAGRLRTQALSHIRSGWVFHFDSDEWFTRMQIENLKSYLGRLPHEVDCLKIPRRNIEPDRDWDNWPDSRPMIHRADRGITWANRIEEWPVGVKMMRDLPLISEFTVLHVHVCHADRVQAQKCRDDAKAR